MSTSELKNGRPWPVPTNGILGARLTGCHFDIVAGLDLVESHTEAVRSSDS
jgi:hypothetical protein